METYRRRNVMFYLVTFYYEMLIFRYQNRKLLTIICNIRGMFPEPECYYANQIYFLPCPFNSKIAIVRSTKDGRLRDFRATRKYESVFQSVLVI